MQRWLDERADYLDSTKQALRAKKSALKVNTQEYGLLELNMKAAQAALGRGDEVMRDFVKRFSTVYTLLMEKWVTIYSVRPNNFFGEDHLRSKCLGGAVSVLIIKIPSLELLMPIVMSSTAVPARDHKMKRMFSRFLRRLFHRNGFRVILSYSCLLLRSNCVFFYLCYWFSFLKYMSISPLFNLLGSVVDVPLCHLSSVSEVLYVQEVDLK